MSSTVIKRSKETLDKFALESGKEMGKYILRGSPELSWIFAIGAKHQVWDFQNELYEMCEEGDSPASRMISILFHDSPSLGKELIQTAAMAQENLLILAWVV